MIPSACIDDGKQLEGKVAIITGAASGIGEATARLFVEHGALVVIADVQDGLGLQVASSLGADKATYKHCDVSDEKQVKELVDFTLQKFRVLDIMFSNARIIGPLGSILDMNVEGFDKTMAINVRGSALAIKHAARIMVAKRTHGSIICTASIEATVAGRGPPPYTASKAAVLGLVKAAASELGQYGIRVNCISPRELATPMVCNAYNMNPEDLESIFSANSNLKGLSLNAGHVAEAALFLASQESAYVSAHNLALDGGLSTTMMIKG